MTDEARAALAALDDEPGKLGRDQQCPGGDLPRRRRPGTPLSTPLQRCPGPHRAGHRLLHRRRGKPAGCARPSRTRRPARGHRCHRTALALAEPDRLVLPFAITGSLNCSKPCRGTRQLMRRCLPTSLDVMHGIIPARDRASPPEMEQLSPSELRVLRYLPTNLSRPEIASELSVSVNTVNTHVRNIYAKLQARDRSSAVQRAATAAAPPAPRLAPGHLILVRRFTSHTRPWPHGRSPAQYAIRIRGHLGATVLSAFPAMARTSRARTPCSSAVLDQSALYGVLADIEALGLELMEVRQLTGRTSANSTADIGQVLDTRPSPHRPAHSTNEDDPGLRSL